MRFALTIFLGAFLLFLVQPLISKAILPWFGGSPALWTTCMLFFQVVLLGGYAYAHVSVRYLPLRRAIVLHLVLLALATLTLPILPNPSWKPLGGADPTARILGLLLVSIGLPFLLLSSTTPLLQGWYSRAHGGALPYRLYALSNLGSLLALVGYPFLLQPLLDLPSQSGVWSAGFVAFGIACAVTAAHMWRLEGRPETSSLEATSGGSGEPHESKDVNDSSTDPAPPSAAAWSMWLALPAVGSVLLLGVTNRMSQDIAVVPFLWVLPLALYLLTFVIAFEREAWYRRAAWLPLLVPALLGMAWVLHRGAQADYRLLIAAYSGGMFVGCMVCHGELARLKPPPAYLTAFYLALSAGGALGGTFVALLAPRAFVSTLELPLGMVACAALAGWAVWRDPDGPIPRLRPARARAFGLVALLLIGLLAEGLRRIEVEQRQGALSLSRNFYGVLRVEDHYRGTPHHYRSLAHGNVSHGVQLLDPARRRVPTAYFHTASGIGRLMRSQAQRPPMRVGLVGLGIGTLAAYGRPGDRFRFYEIDPAVTAAAKQWFSYLADSQAECVVVEGDARISLEREEPNQFDMLVLDAFSSDAIPVHLLTREAFKAYLQHLKPGAPIAVHITNRAIDLRPVLHAAAEDLGWTARFVETPRVENSLIQRTMWAILTPDPALYEHALLADLVEPLSETAARVRPWTDAYSDLLPLLRARE